MENEFIIPNEIKPKVFKNECIYCPFSLETETIQTLYVCLHCGQCFCEECKQLHFKYSTHYQYLKITQIEIQSQDSKNLPESQKCQETNEKTKTYQFFNIKSNTITELTEITEKEKQEYIQHFISCTSEDKKASPVSSSKQSKILTKEIKQKERKTKIDLKTVTCEHEGCSVKNNLWLNLIDGSVLCGRENPNFEGNGHALKHYDENKENFLVVKLGTITSDGTADIYDYQKDDDVIDLELEKHLAFYGIDMKTLEKTQLTLDEIAEQQMIEMERKQIETNDESDEKLSGEYYVGIRNTGNTCYIASCVQLLFNIDILLKDLIEKYDELIEKHWEEIDKHVTFQLARLAKGFKEGKCSQFMNESSPYQIGMSVKYLKEAVGNHYQMYKTSEQQDVIEFMLYLFQIMEKEGYTLLDESTIIKFRNEVKTSRMNILNETEKVLIFPLDVGYMAIVERKHVDLNMKDVIKNYSNATVIDDYRENGKVCTAIKKYRISQFPNYLFVKLQREVPISYEETRKIDCDVFDCETIDLNCLKSDGTQLQEKIEVNEQYLQQMIEMGLNKELSEYALRKSGNDPDKAMMMIFDGEISMNDMEKEKETKSNEFSYENELNMLIDMGFDAETSKKALIYTHGDMENSVILIAEDSDELKNFKIEDNSIDDKKGKYELIGIVCHIGANSNCGHYVSHVKKDKHWVMFNDNKVFESSHPPLTKGSLCLYKLIE